MPRLIAVLRRPRALLALLSERTEPLSPHATAVPRPYRERLVALADVSEAVCPWRNTDVKAWKALGRVPNPSRRASLAILRALIATVADPDAEIRALSPLTFPNDLRPYLCDPHHERELVATLAEVLEDATRDLDFPDWHWTRRAELTALPPGFRTHFLWGLHLSPWTQVELTRAAYDELDLDSGTALRSAVARLLSFADRDVGLWWCDVLTSVEAPHRVRAAELILESGASARTPDDASREALIAGDWPRATRALLDIAASDRAIA